MPDQKRKSKEQLVAAAEAARKKQEGRLAKTHKKEKKPTRCEVMPCRCLGVDRIGVKNPGLPRGVGQVWLVVGISTKNLGAEWQDRKLGRGLRYHNPRFAKGKLVGWTCTVCGEEKRV